MSKIREKSWLAFFIFLSFFIGLVYVLWPNMRADTDFVCYTTIAVITTSVGGNSVTTYTPYTDCYYVTYYYWEDYGYGGSETDADWPPGGGGGSSDVTVNPHNSYDNNSDGFVDCYEQSIFHTSGLTITADCNDPRSSSKTGTHDALDLWIEGIDGKEAYSVCDGEVVYVGSQVDSTGKLTGYGYYVKIRDPEGNYWVYAHLKGSADDPSGVGLTVGTKVTGGLTEVGKCDNSGTSTGAHLHLEYSVNGIKTCPTNKLNEC
ncbi:MAG: M23 family metallopeptidase [Acidobacteriota bacterium]|nr:M23 family metallopeptidase [Acidobacteriota bacterium]